MKPTKKFEKIMNYSIELLSLFIILFGIFLVVRELIIGIPFGTLPINLLIGGFFTFLGTSMANYITIKEQDIEIEELKKKLKNETK